MMKGALKISKLSNIMGCLQNTARKIIKKIIL